MSTGPAFAEALSRQPNREERQPLLVHVLDM